MYKKKTLANGKAGLPIGRSKDDSNMLEALKMYEAKNYKKSLKLLDTILKKNSNHVDSIILKGLNLQVSGTAEEAATYINKALTKIKGTLVSPIGGHLLGIYYRQVKDYTDAVKWFKAALDNGSTNTQIYRDLATLQSQIHDYKGALESRRNYWENYKGYRANWTSLAVANDLNGHKQVAISTLSTFEELAEGKLGEPEMYENSECIMYKNDLLYRNAGNDKKSLEKALEHLEKVQDDVYDKFGWLERKASILMKLGRSREASLVYRTLIKRSPDDFKYYRLLEVSLGIQGNESLKKALYEKLAVFYPKSEPPKFIPLTFIKDKVELTKKISDYITTQLNRGVPATFNNIKPLYKKEGIPDIIENIVLPYHSALSPDDQPIQFVWTTYFLALHFLHRKEFEKANDYADKAMEHTPTLVEIYILKARVLKHLGLLEEAASVINRGRELDLQDRFINAKTTKYMLRADDTNEAIAIVSLFTKNDVNGVPDLHLLEASWFIVEQAESFFRLYKKSLKELSALKEKDVSSLAEEELDSHVKLLRDLEFNVDKYEGLSLKRFMALPKIYRQFEDDQLDFHSYCMRKGTPRAYLNMLEWGNHIYTLPMFVRAMEGASKIVFQRFDSSKISNSDEQSHDDIAAKKKNSKKAKKEAAALNRMKEDEKAECLAYVGDKDPLGETLLNDSDPLGIFEKEFLKPYLSQATDSTRRHLIEFEFHLRTGKLALALGALTKYIKVNGKDSVAASMALVLLENTKDSYLHDDIAKKVAVKGIEKEFPELLSESENKLGFVKETFGKTLPSLLILYRHSSASIPEPEIKEDIISVLQNEEPAIQHSVLEYEF
ncbi:unnamed protein product [Kluyveromyces dobzhanskii CBS 2104]|uniref:WGS project CCBQ000000000 data, contig 00015 n=1 Tax=Kluyveromyces dobzhanskii CBS 2104 TaxID=1427455 RepID=A0A0A8LA01_9SACH|nr:unnamed protein product [Kluyveromyces dobzhanskii CBS 2104]